MFARDVEGRIGMDAGFGVSVTRPVVLGISLLFCPPGLGLELGAGPRPCTTAGRGTQGPTADRASELRKWRFDAEGH